MKKQILSAFIISVTLFACSSSSQIVSSWKDPNTSIKTPSVHKIVVAALINDQAVRCQIEDYMASLYAGSATQSYLVLGNDSLITNEEADNKILNNKGYDGVVIMKQAKENSTSRYVPGTPPTFYRSWSGYWGGGWGTSYFSAGSPGYYTTDNNWTVNINAYSVEENKLLWAATTRIVNPGNNVSAYKEVCNAALKRMKKDGFLD